MPHTPGPWIANGENSQEYKVICRGPEVGWNIALVLPPNLNFEFKTREEFEQEWMDNLCLISAAPELLSACKVAFIALRDMTTEEFQRGEDAEVRKELEEAIAKAEGRDYKSSKEINHNLLTALKRLLEEGINYHYSDDLNDEKERFSYAYEAIAEAENADRKFK